MSVPDEYPRPEPERVRRVCLGMAHTMRAGVQVTLAWLSGLLTLAALLGGCGPSTQERLEAIYTLAMGNPAGAQAELVKQWNAQTLKLDDAINLGHDRLEKNIRGGPEFALAVLGAARELEAAAVKAGVNEFYWFRLGTLAGAGGAAAFNAGDMKTAREVVLAGPTRWQGENYWRLHPDHDALASLILHRAGESREALYRLRSRGEPDEQLTAMMARIEAEMAAAALAQAQAEAAKNKKK